MDFTETGQIQKGEDLMILGHLLTKKAAPKIYCSLSSLNIVTSVSLKEFFCSIVCIRFHMLEPKLFMLIIGFRYKNATATITGS